ncbi:MAG: response regulator transcription factor [Chloroflexi bacterium]|nr:response regulator transcription factor [Chloroflexota bacterium]
MNTKKARILLVDDHELFREGVAQVINNQPDMEVVGQADDGLEALTMAHELRPDLILMDINMPLSNGLEATELIRANIPESIIIMLTTHEEEEKLFNAVKAGAQGYILKSTSSTGLIRGIRGALDGESSVPRKLVGQLLAEFSKLSKRPENLVNEETTPIITQREREILNIMATGASNQEIADTLSISLQTVKSHVSSILTKLQAKSRHQAAEFGIKQGFIQRKQ